MSHRLHPGPELADHVEVVIQAIDRLMKAACEDHISPADFDAASVSLVHTVRRFTAIEVPHTVLAVVQARRSLTTSERFDLFLETLAGWADELEDSVPDGRATPVT